MATKNSVTKKRRVSNSKSNQAKTFDEMLTHCNVSIVTVPPNLKGKDAEQFLKNAIAEDGKRAIARRQARKKRPLLLPRASYNPDPVGWFDQVPSDTARCGHA